MKKIIKSFGLFWGVVLTFQVYAQKPVYRFTFKVYINEATATFYGGKPAVENKIKAQFASVNQFYNQEARFTGTYNFEPVTFQYFKESGANQNELNRISKLTPETDTDFRILYSHQPFPEPGGYPTIVADYQVTTRSIRFALDAEHEWTDPEPQNLFGPTPTRILCHELGHARGAADLYSTEVNAATNTVNNQEYKYPVAGIMNDLYLANAWDIHSIASINKAAGSILTVDTWKTLFWSQFPSKMSVRVKNSQGVIVPNAKVTLYNVRWLSKALSTDNATIFTTNSEGKVSFNLTNVAENPYKANDMFPLYSNLMAVVGTQTDNPGWMNVFDVQTTKINGGSEYILDMVINGTPPKVSITSPSNNASFTASSTINIAATASDPDGTVSKVEFYNGTTLLGSDVTSPYTYSWPGVQAGTYIITAKATDNLSLTTTSSAITINVTGGNIPPTVSITAPANNAAFTAPASVTINANAADANGTVSKVEFYNGATLLSSDVTSPYSYTWSGVAAGTYTITAKATDNSSLTTTSSAVTINVTGGNTPPTVSITSPANNAVFAAPASVTINATAADANGTVSKVEFYNGSALLSSDATSPYSYTWSGVQAGTYIITAKATDNSGASTISAAVTIVVNSTTTTDFCFEAESGLGQSTFAPFQVLNDANASGGKYIVVPNGAGNQTGTPANSIATFSFNVPATATYYFWVRILAPTSNDNSMFIRTDNDSYGSPWTPGSYTTWTWKKWTSKSISAGSHILSVARNEDGLQIDKILITKSSSTPSGTGCGAQSREESDVAEAENEVENQLLLSPNPSAYTFAVSATEKAISYLSVSTSLGMVVFTATDIAKGARSEFGSDFENGIYHIFVKYADGKSESVKVVKMR